MSHTTLNEYDNPLPINGLFVPDDKGDFFLTMAIMIIANNQGNKVDHLHNPCHHDVYLLLSLFNGGGFYTQDL